MVHSFPTRRSSDLVVPLTLAHDRSVGLEPEPVEIRSEEHTSELQSHHPISYAVFCLKKKNSRKSSTRFSGRATRAQISTWTRARHNIWTPTNQPQPGTASPFFFF